MKGKFRQASNPYKRILEAAKPGCSKKVLHFPETWFSGIWKIANSVLNKGKSVIPPLCLLHLIKQNVLLKTFLRTLILITLISLHVFPYRTNLKLHSISITPKMVKEVIRNLDSSKASGPDCISMVALKNCEPEFPHILAELFSKCLIFQISHWWSLYLRILGKGLQIKITTRIVDHLEKCGVFSDFEDSFTYSQSTADLLTVANGRIAWVFNRSGATRTIVLDISKAFDGV